MHKVFRWIIAAGALSLLLAACGPAAGGESTAEPTVGAVTPPAQTALPATSEPGGETVDQVQIFLVALEDDGTSGDMIGCNDSIIGVVRPITPTDQPIEAALNELLSMKDAFFGESGLYNALSQSSLTVDSVTVEDMLASVHLSGELLLGGVCDNPRVQAQLEYTVLQFPGVEAVEIFINGEPIQSLLSGQG